MQIDDTEDQQDIELEEITLEHTIVNIDYAISKLRHYRKSNRQTHSNRNHWPETAYIYRESAVLSSQLWLHNIEFFSESETLDIIQQYKQYYSKGELNNQIIIYFNFDLQLQIVINSEIKWTNTELFYQIKTLTVFDYIQYLHPLIQVTGQSIITTIIAREGKDKAELLQSEIVSIGEFRAFYQDNNTQHWRYYKETQEIQRGIHFQFYHNYDLFKAINYKVAKRSILKLNHFIHLEIVIIKKNYFKDIREYYSRYNQLIITPTTSDIHRDQPHQTDRFDSIDHIITEYYPQQ